MSRRPKTLDGAFLLHAPQEGEGCRYWTGNIRLNGYGRVLFHGVQLYAHRYAFEREGGPIPEGMTVDHECHNLDSECPGGVTCLHRRCIRFDHLGLATLGDNSAKASLILRTGRCKRGHVVDSENAYIIRGQPICRECHLRRQAAYNRRVNVHKADIVAKQLSEKGKL